MTEQTNSVEDSSSFGSILSKREAALSSVPLKTDGSSRPTSASSTGSYQLVSGDKELKTPIKSNMASGLKGESLSGGGFTGEKNANLMSILVDSKVASASKKLPSGTTPRGLAYQLYFVTPNMISTKDICGGQLASLKYDAFCGKSAENCTVRTHREKKHSMFIENTVFIIGKTNAVSGSSSDKIINPEQYHLTIDPENFDIARNLISSSNAKLFGAKSYQLACKVFNTFVEEYVFAVESAILERDKLMLKTFSIDAPDSKMPSEVNIELDLAEKLKEGRSRAPVDSSSSSSSSDSHVSESDLSFDDSFSKLKPNEDNKRTEFSKELRGVNQNTMEEHHVQTGIDFSIGFQNDPTRYIAMIGSHMSKQEETIQILSRELKESKINETRLVSRLQSTLVPIHEKIKDQGFALDRNKASLDKLKKKTSDSKIRASTRKAVSEDFETIFQDRFHAIQEEIDAIDSVDIDPELSVKLRKLEIKVLALESGASAGDSLFPIGPVTSPLLPDVVRKDLATLEFKIALLESRVGAQTLKFGNITLKSLVDCELFVNDHIPSFSYGCFFDLVALLDSLRDTTTTEKSFLESEYNAQKTKFVSVDEASTSASFLHVAPLVFCGSSSSSDSKYGSIERSLPHVKSREHWVSLGGMEGMKRQLEEEILSKVGAILEEIPMTLGDSRGADLAKSYLISSQTCFNKFVNWTESFYQELLGNSQVTEKEAWSLILHCWMAFFSDLRQIRMACSNLSPGRHEVGSEGRTRIVARYVWTMGRAIVLQNEYCGKQFRNHPSIATVINYHMFQHRVPMSLYKTTMGRLEGEVKTINAWKAQLGREMKDLKKVVSDRS